MGAQRRAFRLGRQAYFRGPSSTTRERLRFALSAQFSDSTPRRRRVASANQLDDAGNASLGGVSPTVEESVLRYGPAALTPSDAFPCTEYVASLAMVRFSNPAAPCGLDARLSAKCGVADREGR